MSCAGVFADSAGLPVGCLVSCLSESALGLRRRLGSLETFTKSVRDSPALPGLSILKVVDCICASFPARLQPRRPLLPGLPNASASVWFRWPSRMSLLQCAYRSLLGCLAALAARTTLPAGDAGRDRFPLTRSMLTRRETRVRHKRPAALTRGSTAHSASGEDAGFRYGIYGTARSNQYVRIEQSATKDHEL